MLFTISLFSFCFWGVGLILALISLQYILCFRRNLMSLRMAIKEQDLLMGALEQIGVLNISMKGVPKFLGETPLADNLNAYNQWLGKIKLDGIGRVVNPRDLFDVSFLDADNLPIIADEEGIDLSRIAWVRGENGDYAATFTGSIWRLVYKTGKIQEAVVLLSRKIKQLQWYLNPVNFFRIHPLLLVAFFPAGVLVILSVLYHTVTWK